MTATEETVQTKNRCSGYFDEIQNRKLPKLPKKPKEREQIYQDAVLQAVVAMQKLLTHENVDKQIKAAEIILALEKTRMRHSSEVTGTQPPPQRTYLANGLMAPSGGDYLLVPEELKDDDLYKVYEKHIKVAQKSLERRAKEFPNEKRDASRAAAEKWVRWALDELDLRADDLELDCFCYEKTTWR